VGFPLGATLPEVKVFETQRAIQHGAQEIDMVINIGALKSGQLGLMEADIRGVVEASHAGSAICKVIIETCLLTKDEKIRAALAVKNAGADFVKTSTGSSTAGATPADVRLIRETVGAGTGIKAAGGVRTLADLETMMEAGATRIGASAGVKIVEQARAGTSAAPSDVPERGGNY
jgi:deoxyribose-phosphate aldolase